MDSALPPLSNAKSKRTRQQLAGAAALILLLIFAAWLRTAHFDESLWLDELHTSWTIHDSLADVAPRAAMGNQPPLPYWLWWAWVQLVGESEFTLRFPSLVASLAAIAILYFAVLRWTGSYLAAMTAAVLLTIEPLALFYGGEARVYAWLQALGLLHVALLVELLRNPSAKVHWLWVVLGVVLIYTHFTAALFVGAAFFVALIAAAVPRWQSKYRFRAILLDAALTTLALLPAIPSLRMIAARRDNWAQFIDLPSAHTLHELVGFPQTLGLAVIAFIVGWGLTKLHRQKAREEVPQALPSVPVPVRVVLPVLLLWFGLPLLVASILSQLDIARLFYPRYLIMATMAMPAVIGMLLGSLHSLRGRTATAVLLIATGLIEVGAVQAFLMEPHARQAFVPSRRENWRDAVAAVNQRLNSTPGRYRTVILSPGLIELSEDDALETEGDLRSFATFPLQGLYELDDPKVNLVPVASVRDIFATARKDWDEKGTDSAIVVVRGTREQDLFEELYRQEQDLRYHFLWYKTERTRLAGMTVFVLWTAPP